MRIYDAQGLVKHGPGPTGATGAQGPVGPPGPPGADGEQGEQGDAGPPGPAGAAGANGSSGTVGPPGVPGPAGEDGADGDMGPPGSQGPAGANANLTPDSHPSSPNVANDEFETGSSIDTTGARTSGATAWTALGLSTGTTSVANGSLLMKPALTASRNLGGYTQPVSGTWAYTAKFSVYNSATNTLIGLFIATASGAAGNILVFGINQLSLIVQRLTNNTTFSANQLLTANAVILAVGTALTPATVQVYLRVAYDGTNLTFSVSSSGVEGTFQQVYTETSAAFLGTPTLVGIGGDNESAGTQAIGIYDWFRKTA